MATVIHDLISVNPLTGLADVTHGPARTTIRAHIHHVALAYLEHAFEGDEHTFASNVVWQDNLISHGIAMAVQNNSIMTLAVIPSRLRTINDRGTALNVAFPPVLMALKARAGRYVTGFVFCVNPTAVPTLAINGAANVLLGFPFGNIYEDGAICWGTVGFRQLDTLAKFENLFFTTTFNHDLWRGGGHYLAHWAAQPGGVVPAPTRDYHTSISAIVRRLEGAE